MTLQDIKQLLNKNDLPVWKLIRVMNISRNTFYSASHANFKGYEDKLNKGLKTLGVIKNDK